MSKNRHIDKICLVVISITLIITILFMFGEKLGITVIHNEEDENTNKIFTDNDLNADWDTSDATQIVLNDDSAIIDGNGAYFSNQILHIAYAGKYIISGTLNGSVYIDADGDDKIWILFDGVQINSETDPPLYIKQADKVFLTLKDGTSNSLTFENDDENADIDGCIFSRDDLSINGNGDLTVVSDYLHGIVCNDSLVFTGGNINITAKVDGVHAHDAIKICNTTITVSAGDDGLHAGNDDESSVFYLDSGNIDITQCYEGIEANDITIAGGSVNINSEDDGINANGSSTTSLITINGGDITIINKDGRDADGIDSNGDINIAGGNVFISVLGSGTNNAVDYASESGGKFTISGGSIIACGSSQMAESPEQDSTQGFIMQTVSGNAEDIVSVLDEDENEIISKEIPCSFTSVLVSCPDISVGDNLKLKIGENNEIEVTVSSVPENMQNKSDKALETPDSDKAERGTPPEMPDGENVKQGTPPEMPDGEKAERGNPPEMPDGDKVKSGNTQGITDKANKEQDDAGGISYNTIIEIVISVIILAVGLIVVIRKKIK